MLIYSHDYVPALIFGSNIDVQNEWPSIMATADDLEDMKASMRRMLPDLKPTERLEYLARAFGYRSAASLQAALKGASSTSPVILTPQEGYPDLYRFKHLLAREDRYMETARQRSSFNEIHTFHVGMRDIAGIICRDIRAKRTPGYARDNRFYDAEHAGIVVTLGGDAIDDADLACPSLNGRIMRAAKLDFDECRWDPELRRGETVQLLDVDYEPGFSDEELHRQIEGDHPLIQDRRPSWAMNQEASRHRHRATLLHRQEDGLLAGSLTFEITCLPIPVEQAEAMARDDDMLNDFYPEDVEEHISFLTTHLRSLNWRVALFIEQSTINIDLTGAQIERSRVVLEAAVLAILNEYLQAMAHAVAGPDNRYATASVDLSFNPESVWGEWDASLSEAVNIMVNELQADVAEGFMGPGEMDFFVSEQLADYLEDESDIPARRP